MKSSVPKLVTIAVLTLITVVFWVFFGAYRALMKVPQLDVDEKILEPVNPTLDTNTLIRLESRIFIPEGEIEQLVGQVEAQIPSPSPTPTASATPLPTFGPTATPSATPTPTAGGGPTP